MHSTTKVNSINLVCEKSTDFHESQFRSQNKHIEYITQSESHSNWKFIYYTRIEYEYTSHMRVYFSTYLMSWKRKQHKQKPCF